MKKLYKLVKVIHNAHENKYEVYYRNWFRWHFDRCYKVDKYTSPESARVLAIERAESLLRTVEVFRKSSSQVMMDDLYERTK